MHIMGAMVCFPNLEKSPTFHHQVASTGRDGLREALKLGRKVRLGKFGIFQTFSRVGYSMRFPVARS